MLISVLLIFIKHSQMKFGEELTVLGASAVIENPSFILPFLLTVQAYFLWRFYQYFHTDKAYSALKGQYNGSLSAVLDSSTMKEIFKSLPEGVTSLSGSYTYSKLEKTDANYYQVEAETPGGEEEPKIYSVKVPKAPIERKRIGVLFGFMFRGRILSDFFLPYALVVYAVLLHIL